MTATEKIKIRAAILKVTDHLRKHQDFTHQQAAQVLSLTSCNKLWKDLNSFSRVQVPLAFRKNLQVWTSHLDVATFSHLGDLSHLSRCETSCDLNQAKWLESSKKIG